MQEDQDETLYSDSKDENEDGAYSQEDAETGNDILKQKSIKKMKDVPASASKGPKSPKEKPKQSIQQANKVIKIKEPKKIKAEKPDGMKGRQKSKLRTQDGTNHQSKDNPAKDDTDDDEPNRNVGVHNMSVSPDSERDMEVDEVHDEPNVTQGNAVERLEWVEIGKDKLITTNTGEIIRRENYVIPRKKR